MCGRVAAGTSLAALVFIGFDGVSILAEEVKNPKRNVLLATVLVVVFTGLFSGLQVYHGAARWPDYTTLQNPETAFMDVARMASGPFLFAAYGVMLLISSIACGLGRARGRVATCFTAWDGTMFCRRKFSAISARKKAIRFITCGSWGCSPTSA